MQLVIGIDFSKSNEWTGENTYGKPLHGDDYLNPYMHCLQLIEPIIRKFDDDQIIPVYRFGCLATKDKTILPLLAPENNDAKF
jgi:E3 ubiquitin-protein ligase RGLG